MKTKENNKILGNFNIIIGMLIGIITFLLNYIISNKLIHTYFYSDIEDICFIFCLIFSIIITVINMMYLIKRKHIIKNLISAILSILIVWVAFIILGESWEITSMYLYCILIISGIIMSVGKKDSTVELNKFYNIITKIIIIIIGIILMGVVTINFQVKISFIEKGKSFEEMLISAEGSKIEEELIPVKKGGYWGYVNENGEEKIEYVYDEATEFLEISFSKRQELYYVALAKKDNIVYLINKENIPIKTFEYNGMFKDSIGNLSTYDLRKTIQDIDENNEMSVNYYSNNNFENDDIDNRIIGDKIDNRIIFKDKLNYYIDQKKWELHTNIRGVEVEVINSKEIYTPIHDVVDISGKINCYRLDDFNDYYAVDVFQSGYIPFYNFEEKSQGWIDIDNEKIVNIEGKRQVIDVVDEKVLIKDFSDRNEIKVYITDLNGKKISGEYKEIFRLSENLGYILQTSDSKYVYMSDKLKETVDKYDYILLPDNYGTIRVIVGYNVGKNLYDVINMNDCNVKIKDANEYDVDIYYFKNINYIYDNEYYMEQLRLENENIEKNKIDVVYEYLYK